MIALRDVLNTMEAQDELFQPKPFSLKCITYDAQKKTGGEILTIDKAILSEAGKRAAGSPRNAAQEIINQERSVGRRKRNPGHHDNYTRNIEVLPGGNIRKIHPLLIIEFNGQKVF